MVDKILDTAGQKGTGKWTAIRALDLGMPLTLIGESGLRPLPLRAQGGARRRLQGAHTGRQTKTDGDQKDSSRMSAAPSTAPR